MDYQPTKPDHSIGGLKIQTCNYIMIVIACIIYAFLLYETIQVSYKYNALIEASNDYIRCEEAANMVTQGSDILTNQVRMFVVTGDLSHAQAYFQESNVDQKRDRALEELTEIHPDDAIHDYLQSAIQRSYELMEREIYAMKLTAVALDYEPETLPEEVQAVTLSEEDLALSAEEQRNLAIDLVYNSSYQDAKNLILGNISYCLDSTLNAMHNVHAASVDALNNSINRQRVFITLLFIMNVVVFFFIIVLIIRPLKIYIKCISDNKTLEIVGSYEFKYLALTYNNIYELNAANEVMLRKQAEHDPLTGILNRGAFDQLRIALREHPSPMAFLLIDVDKFKQINDNYGHPTGDQVLKRVASMLTSCFRSTDFVARIGGDEFCAVVMDFKPEQKVQIEQKILEMNEHLKAGEDGLPTVSISVGAAFSDRGFDDNLYKCADTALYISKNNGRGRCTIYDPNLMSGQVD